MGDLLFRNKNGQYAIYDTITCPKCNHVGCEPHNATMPTIWHCPRCDFQWNPDSPHNRTKPIEVGDDITVGDLRLGDIVVYLMTKGDGFIGTGPFHREKLVTVPHENPYMQMSVVAIDNYGITLKRPYIGYHSELNDPNYGEYYCAAETVHFRFDASMGFRLLYRS